MFFLYRVFSNLIYPFLFIFIYLRIISKKEDPTRYKEKILISHFSVKRNPNKKLIWFHAASIGELKSVLPIIKDLNNKNNNLEFLITTITLSSSNLAKEELKKFNNVQHRFFPFDVNFLIKKFLYLWKPSVILLVDSEIWPNLIVESKKKNIQIGLINARITTKSFNRWMIFQKTARKIFSLFDICLSSNSQTKEYLFLLNAKNIHFKGNIKLIRKVDTSENENVNNHFLANTRFWLAASTHEPEENLCLKTHLILKEKFKNVVTIIAPRHINRVNKIKSLADSFNLDSQILNKNEKIIDNKEIIIINTFGELQNYYKFAKCVFIGKSSIKSFKNVGGQNPIDAAYLNCKIYHGPYVYNFQEIYETLAQNNISIEIKSYYELAKYLIKDLEDAKKEDIEISSSIKKLSQKTLIDTMEVLNSFIINEFK
mgnify:CR=1 FL=1